jgi:hypothetical protein
MRDKYRDVLGTVLNEVNKRHPELDCRGMDLELDEDDDAVCGCLNLGIGRKAWPSMSPRAYPTGLWICGITLGELITRGERSASASVWINPSGDSRLDLRCASRRLEDDATRLEPTIRFRAEVDDSQGSASIEYELPESRKKLLDFLVEDESRGFIRCMVGHFDTLAKFIPVIDGLFQHNKRRRN